MLHPSARAFRLIESTLRYFRMVQMMCVVVFETVK